jgi:YidC/Oxa1 family membrane protein insertase
MPAEGGACMNIVLALVAFNSLQPIVWLLQFAIALLNGFVHSFGWSMVLLAVSVRLVFWKLNAWSARAMLRMQRIAPQVKALQSEFDGEREALSTAMMALYKREGVNPMSAFVPQLVQLPIIISVYWAVMADKSLFATQSWLWIGSPLAARVPWHLLAANLASLDCLLLILYVISMYLSIRSAGTPSDPQAAKQQKLMAIVSPGVTGAFGFKYAWPSAMLIYWLTGNIIAILQQRLVLASSHRKGRSFMSSAPPWLELARDYALFLSGRAYPSTVNVRLARLVAIGLLGFGVFATLTQVLQISYHGVVGGPSSLVVVSAMMTGFFLAIMRATRGTALP